MNDQATLERWVSHRDAEAFRVLVHAHAGMVFSACHRVLKDAADAEAGELCARVNSTL